MANFSKMVSQSQLLSKKSGYLLLECIIALMVMAILSMIILRYYSYAHYWMHQSLSRSIALNYGLSNLEYLQKNGQLAFDQRDNYLITYQQEDIKLLPDVQSAFMVDEPIICTLYKVNVSWKSNQQHSNHLQLMSCI